MPHVVNLEPKRCYMIDFYCISDTGLHRSCNQDSYVTCTNENGDFLALVADGIGGGRAGDVASLQTVEYVKRYFNTIAFTSLDDAKDKIDSLLKQANKYVFDLSMSNIEYFGMGTTLTGILITSFGNLSINVGDSRTYGVVDKKLFRLTVDHTYVNQMLEKGEITYKESLTHPKRHYLTRAVGVFDSVEYDIHKVKDMDMYLLCSDGLCGYLQDNEIMNIIDSLEYDTLKKKGDALIEKALKKGGFDNVTVVLVSDENC